MSGPSLTTTSTQGRGK